VAAFLTALAALGAPAAPATATPAGAKIPGPRHVVVILLDRTTPQMVSSVGTVQSLDAQGASGMMSTANAPGAGGDAPLAGVATLSAGAPAVGPLAATDPLGVQAGVPSVPTRFGTFGALYRTRTGREPSGAIVYPDAGLLERLNAEPSIAAAPGLLGQTLEAHGIHTAAVGDSDLLGHAFRPGAILAMDRRGVVSAGATFGAGRSSRAQVLPMEVREPAVEAAVTSALGQARLVVVDWGDTSSVDRLAQLERARLSTLNGLGESLGSRLAAGRAASLRALDTFLQFLQGELETDRDIIVIVSPSPPRSLQERGVAVAPIVVSGGGIPNGRLTSATTHRLGVVANVDLAPSVLRWFGIPTPAGMTGHPFTVTPAAFPLSDTIATADRFERVTRVRTPVLLAAFVMWLLAIAFSLSLTLVEGRSRGAEKEKQGGREGARRRTRRRGGKGREPVWSAYAFHTARTLLIGTAGLPLVLLLEALWIPGSGPVAILEVIGGAIALGGLLALAARRRTAMALGVMGVLTLLAVLADAATGGHLAAGSLAGSNIEGGTQLAKLGGALPGTAIASAVLTAAVLGWLARRERRARAAVAVLAAVGLAALVPAPLGGAAVLAIAGIPAVAVGFAFGEPTPPGRRMTAAAASLLVAGVAVIGVVALLGMVGRAHDVDLTRGFGGSGPATPAILAAVGQAALLRWLRLLGSGVWTAVIVLAAALVVIERRVRAAAAPLRARRARGPVSFERTVHAAVLGLVTAAIVAVVASATGPATAGVVLMAAAALSATEALDRAYGKG
jgi:hypothetical protein